MPGRGHKTPLKGTTAIAQRRWNMLTGTLLSEALLTTLFNGYAGTGSRFAQVPLWMWAGCGSAYSWR